MRGESAGFGGIVLLSGLYVFSKKSGHCLQIEKVSTVGAKFGKTAPDDITVQARWDFAGFASKDFVPLPIPSSPEFPDNVTFDEARKAYVLHFNSDHPIESERTTILVPKKDLTEAFDYYSQWIFGAHPIRPYEQACSRALNYGLNDRFESPDWNQETDARDQFGILIVRLEPQSHFCVVE